MQPCQQLFFAFPHRLYSLKYILRFQGWNNDHAISVTNDDISCVNDPSSSLNGRTDLTRSIFIRSVRIAPSRINSKIRHCRDGINVAHITIRYNARNTAQPAFERQYLSEK